MLRLDNVGGTIACFCGKHVGTFIGGMRQLLTPYKSHLHPQFLCDTTLVGNPKQTPVWTSVSSNDLGVALRQLIKDLLKKSWGTLSSWSIFWKICLKFR